jgi:hypothetical protein
MKILQIVLDILLHIETYFRKVELKLYETEFSVTLHWSYKYICIKVSMALPQNAAQVYDYLSSI